mmetsp:Transcript_13651/g.54705  ORF Transcript_13651/g.54705 Transcript_13651/m.54705 type:complete len:201 (+) Transcript_13651:345-947(+)
MMIPDRHVDRLVLTLWWFPQRARRRVDRGSAGPRARLADDAAARVGLSVAERHVRGHSTLGVGGGLGPREAVEAGELAVVRPLDGVVERREGADVVAERRAVRGEESRVGRRERGEGDGDVAVVRELHERHEERAHGARVDAVDVLEVDDDVPEPPVGVEAAAPRRVQIGRAVGRRRGAMCPRRSRRRRREERGALVDRG